MAPQQLGGRGESEVVPAETVYSFNNNAPYVELFKDVLFGLVVLFLTFIFNLHVHVCAQTMPRYECGGWSMNGLQELVLSFCHVAGF